MRLSREEETFLRHWIYDEVHYLEGIGLAKQLQVERRAVPADLAVLVAAAIPDPAEQESAARTPPPATLLNWPWSAETLRTRVAEARRHLSSQG